MKKFFHRIASFHKKSDAYYVALVLDIQGLGGSFTGPGYCLPDKTPIVPQGLDSFPAIFSIPHIVSAINSQIKNPILKSQH